MTRGSTQPCALPCDVVAGFASPRRAHAAPTRMHATPRVREIAVRWKPRKVNGMQAHE
jgi:hypothetical protein